jgi:hypothetical protein
MLTLASNSEETSELSRLRYEYGSAPSYIRTTLFFASCLCKVTVTFRPMNFRIVSPLLLCAPLSLAIVVACSSSPSTPGTTPATDAGDSPKNDAGPNPVKDSGSPGSDAGGNRDAGIADDAGPSTDGGVVDAGPPATWTMVHTELKAKCTPCHAGNGFGGHDIGQADEAAAYMDSQQDSTVCAGDTVGGCSAKRIRQGTMPAGGLSASEKIRVADIMDSWIAGGQLP